MKSLLLLAALSGIFANAEDRTVVIGKHDTDRVAWTLAAKNSLALDPKRLGKVAIAESTLATWEVSDRSQGAADMLVNEYNKLAEKYESNLRIAESAKNFQLNPTPFKYAEVALETAGKVPGVSPWVGIGVPLGKAVIQDGKSALEGSLGPAAQLQAQKQLVKRNELLQRGLDTLLGRVYDRSLADPEYAAVAQQMFGSTFNARVGEPADKILARNPVLASQVTTKEMYDFLKKNLGPKGELTVSAKGAEAAFKSIQGDLRKLLQAEQARMKEQGKDQPLNGFLSDQEGPTPQELAAYKERQLFYQNYETSLGAITQIFRFVDPKMAQAIGTMGRAYIGLIQSIDAYNIAAKGQFTFMGGVTLTGNVLSFVGSIFSIFSGPGVDEIILEQLRDLRKDLLTLRDEMHQRFDRIDRSLNLIHENMLIQFGNVLDKLDHVQADVKVALAQLNRLENQLEQFEKLSRQHLEAIVARQFADELWGCEGGWDPVLGRSITWKKYQACLNTYLRCAIQHSTDELATGLAPLRKEPGQVSDDVRQLEFPLSWTKNIRWLRAFASVGSTSTENLVNPNLWSYCSQGYVATAISQPDFLKHISADATGKMLSTGTNYSHLVRQMRLPLGESPLPAVFQVLLKEYNQGIESLAVEIAKEKTIFSADEAAGYDVLANEPLAQTPDPAKVRFKPSLIEPCEKAQFIPYAKALVQIPLNEAGMQALRNAVPKSVLVLGDLRDPNALKVCYHRPRWVRGTCPETRRMKDLEKDLIKIEHQGCMAPLEISFKVLWKDKLVREFSITTEATFPYTLLSHYTTFDGILSGSPVAGISTAAYENGWDPKTFMPFTSGAYLADRTRELGGAPEQELSKVSAPDESTVPTEVKEEAAKAIQDYRLALQAFLPKQIASAGRTVSTVARHVFARQRLLVTYLQMLYPNEYLGSDALRSTLFGTDDAILGSDNVGYHLELLADTQFAEKMKARVANLEKVIAKLAKPDSVIGIEPVEADLQRLVRIQGQIRPAISIAEALANLRKRTLP